ncbi:uncharacterized protein LOC135935544 [Cloeon dipterum]|uniref:uncharacterized protein LOC135935544 n=1 Tax=Cloeon dipterum TaxID=197152 RepID=UPI0032208DD1
MLTDTFDLESSTNPITTTSNDYSPSLAVLGSSVGSTSSTPTAPSPTATPFVTPTTNTLPNTETTFTEVTTEDGEPNLPLYTTSSNFQYGGQIPKPQVAYGQPWQQSAKPPSPPSTNYYADNFAKVNSSASNLFSSGYPSVSYFGYNSQYQREPQKAQPSYTFAQAQGPYFVSESKPAYGQSNYHGQNIKPYRPASFDFASYPTAQNVAQVESPYPARPQKNYQGSHSHGPPKQEQPDPIVYDWHPPKSPHSSYQSQVNLWQQTKPVQSAQNLAPQYDFVSPNKPSDDNYLSSPIQQPEREAHRPSYPTRISLHQQGYNSANGIPAENSGYQSSVQHATVQSYGDNFNTGLSPPSGQRYQTLQQNQGNYNYAQSSHSYGQPPSPYQRLSYGSPPQFTSFVYGSKPSSQQLQSPTSYQPVPVGPVENEKQPPLADEEPSSQQVPPLLLEQQIGGHNQAAATDQTESNVINQCDQVVKVAADRTQVVELSITAGQCNIDVQAPKGRLTLQLRDIMLPCGDQSITVYEGGKAFPLARLCGQITETPLYLLDGSSAKLVVQSRGIKFSFTSFLW